MRFEWDPTKDAANRDKHGVGFEKAKELFESGNEYLELFDEDHSLDEERFIAIGPIQSGVVVVVFTERVADTIRIISARFATRGEVLRFQQYVEEDR